MRLPLLLLAVAPPPNQCSEPVPPPPPCLESYADFSPAGKSNDKKCDHARHRIETENILEGDFVRRVKVTCRCVPESK